MKKINKALFTLSLAMLVAACNNQSKTSIEKQPTKTEIDSPISTKIENRQEMKGDFCFKKTENKDVTDIKFRILSNDDIRGEMIWQPYEKDGAVGTLTGKLISDNEIRFVYSYTIEGNKQTEEKIMKVENGNLYIKKGELLDVKKEGNLTLKDIATATYTEAIHAVKCE